MKILLQSKTNRNYVNRRGGWTWKQASARVFATSLEALMFCLDARMFGMQIVCAFEDRAENFTVSVTDSRQSS